ncbi:hypothetical protein [Aliihoeflea sp. 2WW]|uniref:hypothetical protein n=1 Tax=Aliihoeflea sp. 2WW TaxID=1381123 RepID=UPI0004638519|nr:hypothetical protein [Aliihoeflea sp. 2WW]
MTKTAKTNTQAEQDEALLALYNKLVEREPTVRELSVEDRRDYMRRKKRESREAGRRKISQGKLPGTSQFMRLALADAAIAILQEDGPGADRIREVIRSIFSETPGTALRIEQSVRNGSFKRKLQCDVV